MNDIPLYVPMNGIIIIRYISMIKISWILLVFISWHKQHDDGTWIGASIFNIFDYLSECRKLCHSDHKLLSCVAFV
jgi:hypothetical protein